MLRLTACWAALLSLGAGAAANVIVVRANGPTAQRLAVGAIVADNFRFNLAPGDSVTVLARYGTRIFRGPGAFSAADPIRPAPAGHTAPRRPEVGGVSFSLLEPSGGGGAQSFMLVVRATGPSAGAYPQGRALSAGARIGLRAGDIVVLLGTQGSRTYRGPGIFEVGAARQAGAGILGGFARFRIGAVRESGPAPRPPSVWDLDVAAPGAMCLLGGSGPTLWRADAAASVALSVHAGNGPSQTIAWPAGQRTIPWPADIPIQEGAAYSLQLGDGVPVSVSFRRIAGAPSDIQGIAAAFIGAGCRAQLDQLVEASNTYDAPIATGEARPTVLVDPSLGGDICVAPGAAVALVRRQGSAAALTIRAADGGETNLPWTEGQAVRPWPAALPIEDGLHYRLRSGTAEAQLAFHRLPASSSGDPVATAAALIAAGCGGQLDRLIDETTIEEGDAQAGG